MQRAFVRSIESIAARSEFAVFLIVLTLITPPLGSNTASFFEGAPSGARRVLGGFERSMYRACRVDEHAGMTWLEYLIAAVVFSGVSAAGLILIVTAQKFLPLKPQSFDRLPDYSHSTSRLAL